MDRVAKMYHHRMLNFARFHWGDINAATERNRTTIIQKNKGGVNGSAFIDAHRAWSACRVIGSVFNN